MENKVEIEVIRDILKRYGIGEQIMEQKIYIDRMEDSGWMKLIFRVTLADGKKMVIKIVHEDDDLMTELAKVEKQSIFSETMRSHGIKTPVRYQANERYCKEFVYHGRKCLITVEDWCGEEITEITAEIAFQIGELMARMHTISLETNCGIGSGTLFSAAYQNDVDSFPEFCEITKDANLDKDIVDQIKAIHDDKLMYLRSVWNTLPKAAVQGDVSINNLVRSETGLAVFDYNNAGDEVLISDLVLEGLLTAFEMELPGGVSSTYRDKLLDAILSGYLSVRQLSSVESKAAWEIYTLYHGLWFSRIVYNDDSLETFVAKGEYAAANRLLKSMLADLTATDDGRFCI